MKKSPPRATVLILNDKKFVLIFRHKNGQDYYSIPGGSVKKSETPSDAALREIQEELGLKLNKITSFSVEKGDQKDNYNFVATTDDVDIKVTGPEINRLDNPDNLFKPMWLTKATMDTHLPLHPKSSQKMFNHFIKNL